jgi:hypothetical protein
MTSHCRFNLPHLKKVGSITCGWSHVQSHVTINLASHCECTIRCRATSISKSYCQKKSLLSLEQPALRNSLGPKLLQSRIDKFFHYIKKLDACYVITNRISGGFQILYSKYRYRLVLYAKIWPQRVSAFWRMTSYNACDGYYRGHVKRRISLAAIFQIRLRPCRQFQLISRLYVIHRVLCSN